MRFIENFFSRFESPESIRQKELEQEALDHARAVTTRQIKSPSSTVALCGDCCTPSEHNLAPLPFVPTRKDGTCLHCGSRVVWVDKAARFNAIMRKAGKKPLKKMPFTQLVELAVSR